MTLEAATRADQPTMTTYSDLPPEKQAEVRETAKRIAAEAGVDLQVLLWP